VIKRVREIIESNLSGREYVEELVEQWVSNICEEIIEELHSQRKPFKYIVNTLIMQRTGAAIHTAKAGYMDTVSDAQLTVTWPKKTSKDPNNRTMICVVTVGAFAFYPSGM
jgi:dynein light chain Tctex-type 1